MELQNHDLQEVLDLIHHRFSIDLNGYAKYSLQRRFQHISILNGLRSTSELLRFLEQQHNRESLIEKITVNTTELFRDPALWQSLRTDILPRFRNKGPLSICHMGCSSGEEVHSMVILLTELDLHKQSDCLALDLNKKLLSEAQEASYPNSKLEQFKKNHAASGAKNKLDLHLEQQGNTHFSIRKPEGLSMRFAQFDLVKDECHESFDLIFCRNLLIYFNARLQGLSLIKLVDCLKPGGFLIFGHNESILTQSLSPRLTRCLPSQNIFQLETQH